MFCGESIQMAMILPSKFDFNVFTPPIPDYPVLWVTDSRREAPFGETVRISVD
jgi:hypothetical protein